jgi:tRNA(Ile2) C34 agmatinyltransferase TiaS
MRDGGSEGVGGTALPVADDRVLDTPNCPDCLTRMDAEESSAGEPFWSCSQCGLVALA